MAKKAKPVKKLSPEEEDIKNLAKAIKESLSKKGLIKYKK